ncbi:hypothetical protein [Paraburkholderia youngii]|uniref:hypothetical protein n=1 Tax=Paraburkholderia youngii TaxID=2782701 RepID=UPI003D1D0714
MSIIQFKPYFERRRQTGDIDNRISAQSNCAADRSADSCTMPHPSRPERQTKGVRPGGLVLWDDGLGNRTVELLERWDADESDLECVLLHLLMKLRKGGLTPQ